MSTVNGSAPVPAEAGPATTGNAPDPSAFREAMASFPSGVTIVTTADAAGRWWGFTATSFCSVSMEPPLVLVCLAETAECHPVFARAARWNVHVVHPDHTDLALRFATRGADKFAGGGFVTDEHGMPRLEQACATLGCATHERYAVGDHLVLFGQVESARLGGHAPAVYYRRGFRRLAGG